LHFSAFHPDYRMRDVPPTPARTLTRAREIALEEGLHYAYTGNVHDREGGTTRCPGCGAAVIVRDWYDILDYDVTPEGHCGQCGAAIAGRFSAYGTPFGNRRIPVAMHRGEWTAP
jgi:pyruvate formate lyase activating enzyme